jgi:pyruvate formate lyase activating enzyme
VGRISRRDLIKGLGGLGICALGSGALPSCAREGAAPPVTGQEGKGIELVEGEDYIRRADGSVQCLGCLNCCAIEKGGQGICRKRENKEGALYSYATDQAPLKEATFYRRSKEGYVLCEICPRRCVVPDGGRSFCRNKQNRGGVFYTLVYGKPCTVNMTRPENAPLYHFVPGHRRLALATVGCNLRCKYCQNWGISQATVEDTEHHALSPEEVVDLAFGEEAKSVSFTYAEPTAFYEYVYDISELAMRRGLMTSIVSNGFINPGPLRELLRVIDAVKIDLKGFTDEFYREVSSAELEPVLTSLQIVHEEGVHLEIVNLVVPRYNDDPEIIREMCEWIAENLATDVPLHFTRFFPNYKLTALPPTPVETLEMARRIARDVGLEYVYIGNVPGHDANNTYCSRCGKLLVDRVHFTVLENNVVDGRCTGCEERVPGIWG